MQGDTININRLLLRTIIGVNPEERIQHQNVVLDITLWLDLLDAGTTDDLTRTVDYSKLVTQITDLVENSQFYLIERLAQTVAMQCLALARVWHVRITVEKPDALRLSDSVSVTIERSADSTQLPRLHIGEE